MWRLSTAKAALLPCPWGARWSPLRWALSRLSSKLTTSRCKHHRSISRHIAPLRGAGKQEVLEVSKVLELLEVWYLVGDTIGKCLEEKYVVSRENLVSSLQSVEVGWTKIGLVSATDHIAAPGPPIPDWQRGQLIDRDPRSLFSGHLFFEIDLDIPSIFFIFFLALLFVYFYFKLRQFM